MTTSHRPLNVGATEFDSIVLSAPTPVLVDFWADWCAPCHALAPTIDRIAGDYAGRLRVVKIDADANPEVLQRYGIRALPTLVLFAGGEPVERLSGVQPLARIAQLIDQHVSPKAA